MEDQSYAYVLFKDEDDVGGMPVGPVFMSNVRAGNGLADPVPANDGRWMTRQGARVLAHQMGATFLEA